MIRRSFFLLAALAALGACDTARLAQREKEEQKVTREQVFRNLRNAVRFTTFAFEDAGHAIASRTADLAMKRLTVTMRMRVAGEARDSLWLENPITGFIDLWTFAVQVQQFLTTGDGKSMFGEHQSLAIDAANSVVQSVEAIVPRALPEQFDEATEDVHEFAKNNPIEGAFARDRRQPSRLAAQKGGGLFDWVPSFNPFGGVGQGLDQSAEAIREVGQVADRFTDVVAFLPQELGWRLEVFQYDLEEASSLSSVVDGVHHAADAAAALAKSADALPASVRAQVEAVLEAVDPELQRIGVVLQEVSAASQALDRTGATYADTASRIEAMASQLDTTLQTFNSTYLLLDGDPNAPPEPEAPGERGRPFDVLDYEKTAQSIMLMAAELKGTLDKFHGLVADKELDGRLREAGAAAEDTVASAVWSVALGLVAVLLVFFALLLGYRWLATRYAGRTALSH